MDDSPLGRLSPEIRNIIYEMVLPDPHSLYIEFISFLPRLEFQHPLTKACRQICAESLPMNYARMQLLMPEDDNVSQTTAARSAAWLRKLGPAAFRATNTIDNFFVSFQQFKHTIVIQREARQV